MKRFLIILTVLILGSLILTAGTYSHQQGGISIWFPDNWKVTTEEGLLEAMAPDEDAYANLLVLPDVDSLDEAIDIYTKELDDLVKDFETTAEAESVKFNGLEFYILEGEGYIEDVLMEVGVALILTETTVVMVVTFNLKASAAKYAKEFEQITTSIKAI